MNYVVDLSVSFFSIPSYIHWFCLCLCSEQNCVDGRICIAFAPQSCKIGCIQMPLPHVTKVWLFMILTKKCTPHPQIFFFGKIGYLAIVNISILNGSWVLEWLNSVRKSSYAYFRDQICLKTQLYANIVHSSHIHPLQSLQYMGKQKQFNIANLGSWARGKKTGADKENVCY